MPGVYINMCVAHVLDILNMQKSFQYFNILAHYPGGLEIITRSQSFT